MATFTATAADSTTPAHFRINGLVSRYVRFTASSLNGAGTGALSVGDVIQLCKVPNGSVVVGVSLATSMSAGAISGNLGDGNDTSAYQATSVLSGSAVIATMTSRGMGRSYSAEDTVDFQVSVLSAVPGTAKLFLVVNYYNGNS